MIATVSHNASTVISVSVGQDIRIRDNHKLGEVEKQRPFDKKIVNRNESAELHEAQIPRNAPDQIKEALARLQTTLQDVEPKIELSIDKELNQVIFRIFDKESGELIRQIPPEEVLELDRFFADQSGLFIKEEI